MFTTHGISRWSKTTRALRLECPLVYRPNRGFETIIFSFLNSLKRLLFGGRIQRWICGLRSYQEIIWILNHQKTGLACVREGGAGDVCTRSSRQRHVLVLLVKRKIEKQTTTTTTKTDLRGEGVFYSRNVCVSNRNTYI